MDILCIISMKNIFFLYFSSFENEVMYTPAPYTYTKRWMKKNIFLNEFDILEYSSILN